MNVLVVGTVLKDVYLNLDSRTENFETDKNHTKWLDLSFDAKEHSFFSRSSSLGGAAVSLEVLQKMGISASVSNSNLHYNSDGFTAHAATDEYRYILTTDGEVSYFSSSNRQKTDFTPPVQSVDWLFIDRSEALSRQTIDKIKAYLSSATSTKLALYLKDLKNSSLNSLVPQADLVFLEENRDKSEFKDALPSLDINPQKLIKISENQLSHLNITENISIERVDVLTHLSMYSIIAATILGGLMLKKSVDESFALARINVENSRINSVLTLKEMEKIAENSAPGEDLELIAANLMLKGKGILAADESSNNIKKKFAALNIPDTY